MKSHSSQSYILFGKLLILALVLDCFLVAPAPVAAQRRAVIVTADQPNLWTLEQAHYLLAQMHRRNLDLKAKGLSELDANEITGLRFDVLRTLIEFGATFDDAARLTNKLLAQNMTFNAERRQDVTTRRDRLRADSLRITRNITQLQGERAQATVPEEQARLDAEIERQTALRASVDKEVEFSDNELKTLTAPSGELKATEGQATFDPDKLPKSIFDDAFKDTTKKLIEDFNKAPKLNASLMLENFLQMQYEILAKQLTLLRDEVGPGERIVFLELPQSINATYDKADKKWAQSWWKIVGYTAPLKKEDEGEEGYGENIGRRETKNVQNSAITAVAYPSFYFNNVKFCNLDDKNCNVLLKKGGVDNLGGVKLDDRSVRAVELIPRQGSLNVNDLKLQVRSGAFSFIAKFLFGFGASLNIQRQRESFSQFVQQELYSSAFGKGSREFGWTFTPMPGTNRLLSGIRTTYAVLVVPAEAEALVLKTTGCYFPRSEYQPIDFEHTKDPDRWTDPSRESRNCAEHKAFIVPIPGGGNPGTADFWVERLNYEQVRKGERVVLSIRGKNFSSQMGLLVDGVPLTQAIGVAQPLIRDDSAAGALTAKDIKDERIRGRIERIDAEQLIAVFERLDDKVNTPIITLTAPGRARNLNDMPLRINGQSNMRLNLQPSMFGKEDPPPARPAIRIDKVEIFRSRTLGRLTALITGAGFTSVQPVYINGVALAASPYVSPTLMQVEFPAPLDETIQVTLIAPNIPPVKSPPVANPSHLRINNTTIVSFEEGSKNSPAVLVVRIEGSGFNDDLQTSIGDVVVKSATETLLKLKNPEAATVVTLRDPRTGSRVRTIITRKTSQKEE